MLKLTETQNEKIGRSNYDMVRFFNNLIKEGKLNAFSVEASKKNMIGEIGKKCITFVPLDAIKDNSSSIVKTQNERGYHLDLRSCRYCDVTYHKCVLERLAFNFNLENPAGIMIDYRGRIWLPEEIKNGVIKTSYLIRHESHFENGFSRGNLVIDGYMDGFFERICEFVRK